MSWKDGFHEAVAQYLRYNGHDVSKVLSVEQDEYQGGYCETCAYTSIEVDVIYLDSEENSKNYTYYGSMSEFMQNIT